ncbi:hypothetical protein AU467_34540 [Mesorhizobium loti]|uniref:Uncharacterized protein n=1 Tax=Rhizobium loti TaxID=381 RepID=A0A101KX35_RHILI|nr:hypothetical protein AU467_34540 [Mesorhizobium loti]
MDFRPACKGMRAKLEARLDQDGARNILDAAHPVQHRPAGKQLRATNRHCRLLMRISDNREHRFFAQRS